MLHFPIYARLSSPPIVSISSLTWPTVASQLASLRQGVGGEPDDQALFSVLYSDATDA
jgi:hypothetical protein